MLSSPSDFPFNGSMAFLRPDGAPVKIIQRRADGRVLVARDEPAYARNASTELTVEFDQLAETAAAAVVPAERATSPKPRPRRRQRRRQRRA